MVNLPIKERMLNLRQSFLLIDVILYLGRSFRDALITYFAHFDEYDQFKPSSIGLDYSLNQKIRSLNPDFTCYTKKNVCLVCSCNIGEVYL